MRSTTRRATVSAVLVLSGTLLLTACNDTTSNGTGGSSGPTGAAASSPTSGSTAGSTAGSGGQASGGGQSSGGQSTGGQSNGGGSTASTGGTGGTGGTATAQAAGCSNLVVTAAVKDAVTKAYEAQSGRGHLTPRPHQFLYGQCHGTTYAATAFDLTPGASYNDQVASQDDGSTRRYFAVGPDGHWTVIGAAGFPDMGGCLSKIPTELAKVWNGCPSGNQ